MKYKLTLMVCALSTMLPLPGSVFLGQTETAKPSPKTATQDIRSCDSLKNPIPGESLADASRRIKAWKDCTEEINVTRDRLNQLLVKKLDVADGHLSVAAWPPDLLANRSVVINRLDVYAYNSSPNKHEFSLTVRCGKWSRSVSDNLVPSPAPPPNKGLGKPSFSFDVAPPCNLNEIALELSSPDEIRTKPEETSASVVPGVTDEEMARRLKSVQGSSTTAPNGSVLDKVREACRQRSTAEVINSSPSEVNENFAACIKATNEAEAAIKAQEEAEQAARAQAPSQPAVSPGTLLVAQSCHGQYSPAGITFEGEVQNVSSSPLHSVRAVVSWYTSDGQFLTSLGGPVQFDPLLPHQVSPFQVAGPGNPAMTRYRLQFETYGGETLPSEDRCSSK